jgi:exonuclease SbcD
MKNPVLLLLNDIHASKDNLPEFTANWNEALSICTQRGIPEIAVGGDMFQSRVAQTLDVLLAVNDALIRAAQAGVIVTLAEGNHDLVDQESLRGYNHIFAHHPNVVVVDDFLTLENPAWGFVLHLMSYFPENGSFTDRLNALLKGGLVEDKLNYLYIHEGINGALVTPAEDELPVSIFEPFDKVFVGHYHNRAIVKGTSIEYIGSARQFNFGEDIYKGYTILYADGSHEFIQNEVNARYTVLDVSAEEVTVHLYDRIEEIKSDPRNRIKVRVHGSEAELAAIDRKQLMEAGAGRVEIIGEETAVVDAPELGMLDKFDSRRIRESYEDFCSRKNVDDPSLGLAYLSKIDSSCGN